jgi:tetratricopeptide (TPR) repeat protein
VLSLCVAGCGASPAPSNTEAIVSLTAALEKDSNVQVRGRAARALGRIGSRDVVPTLLRAYEQQPLILEDVVAALRDLGVDAQAIQQDYIIRRPLSTSTWLDRLRDWLVGFDVWQVVRALLIASLLSSIGVSSVALLTGRRWRLAVRTGVKTFAFVVTVMVVGYYWVANLRRPAEQPSIEAALIVTIELARETRDVSLVPWLNDLLVSEDRSLEVKWRTAQALGAIGDARAQPSLSVTLEKSPHSKLRLYSAWALGNLFSKQELRANGLDESAEGQDLLARLTTLVGRYPNTGATYLLRSRAYLALGRYGEARADLARAELLAPQLKAEVLSERGFVFSLQGEAAAALKVLNEALIADGANANTLFRRGLVLVAMELWEEAIADFSATLSADALFAEARVLRAAAYEQLGRTSEAVADYEAYLAGEKSVVDAEVVRGWLQDLRTAAPNVRRRFPFETPRPLPALLQGEGSAQLLLVDPGRAK